MVYLLALRGLFHGELWIRGFGWLVVLDLMALSDSISVYIGLSSREREKEERKDRGE